MTHSQTIALDAMGGDHGPGVIVPAAAAAHSKHPSLKFLFFGDEGTISPVLSRFPVLSSVSSIIHTDKTISPDDKPSAVLRGGRGSSMFMAIEAVAKGQADGVVSAGNTGALMVLSKLLLKCLPGISRPAIASVFPTLRGQTVMLDLGANLACDADVLAQFALLGAVYARVVKGIEVPTIGGNEGP